MTPPYFSWGRWIFAAKLFTAAMLAFTIAVHIGLTQPYWAMVTCCVVMNPLSGAIRSKAVYRFAGTLCAGIFGVALAALFANAPVLLVISIGLVATAAFGIGLLDRTPRSYGFQLFGLTMMLIIVPQIGHPENMFATAVSRLTEVWLGIACATFIDSVFFPRSLAPAMRERLHAWLPDVQRWFDDALTGREHTPEATKDRLRVIGDVTALSALAGQLRYDPLVQRRERKLAFAIQQRVLRLIPLISGIESRIMHADVQQDLALESALAEASRLLKAGEAPPSDFAARMNAAEEASTSWRRLVRRNMAVVLHDALVLSAQIHALDRALDTGEALSPDLERAVARARVFTLRPDFHVAARVSIAILIGYALLCALWFLTGWQQAPAALLFGSVGLAFFGGLDEAGAAIAKFSRFAVIASAAGALLSYALLPLAGDYWSFAIVMGIFIMPLAAWSATNPLAILLLALALSTINLQGHYEPLPFGTYLDASFATLLGLFVAFFCLNVARQTGAGHAVRRFTSMARNDLRILTKRANARDRDLFIIRSLDRIGALTTRLQGTGEDDDSLRLLKRMRVGANIADLRHAADQASGTLRQSAERLLSVLRGEIDGNAPSLDLLARIDETLTLAVDQPKDREGLLVRGLIGLRLALFEPSPGWVRAA